MGAQCFKASSKDKTLPGGAHMEVSQQRNVRHSSPLFRWDNRTHIEDIMDASSRIIPQPDIANFNGSEIKNVPDRNVLASGPGSSGMKTGDFGKLSQVTGQANNSSHDTSSQEAANMPSHENLAKSSTKSTVPSTSSPSTANTNSSSSNTRSQPLDKTSSSKSPKSAKTPNLLPNTSSRFAKSPLPQISMQAAANLGCSIRPDSFNHDANHWTYHTFTELVASSQKAKPSFDCPIVGLIRADTRIFDSVASWNSTEEQFCKICTKSMKERSSLDAQKIYASNNELTVTSVLDCGHVFHAVCLEKMTPEVDMYDPQCPLCMHGEKYVAKMLGKMEAKLKKNKKPKQEGPFLADKLKSYSLNGSLSKTSFLNRCHLSPGLTPSRSVSQGESSRKNLFAKFRD